MIALNVVLMVVVVLLIASALAWAIVTDRRSKRARGGAVSPSDAPLHHNLVMPREMLRTRRIGRLTNRRNRGPRTPTA
jgi:heme/copper-type cytochrome/quinol oxidase subunit 2